MTEFFSSTYELYTLGIIVFAACLRIFLASQGWPPTNSDEGIMFNGYIVYQPHITFSHNPIPRQKLQEHETEHGTGEGEVVEVKLAVFAYGGQHNKGGKYL